MTRYFSCVHFVSFFVFCYRGFCVFVSLKSLNWYRVDMQSCYIFNKSFIHSI